MTDTYNTERQQWLRGLQRPQAKCYERNPDGSPVFRYTPAAEQDADYLRRKFEEMRKAS